MWSAVIATIIKRKIVSISVCISLKGNTVRIAFMLIAARQCLGQSQKIQAVTLSPSDSLTD